MEDRAAVELSFPLAVGDWYLRKNDTAQAIKIYLAEGDRKQAEKVTVELATRYRHGMSETMLQNTFALLLNSIDVQNKARLGAKITLLLSLVRLPLNLEQSPGTQSLGTCYREFGGDFVKWAVKNAGLEDFYLHYFDKTFFTAEVLSSLEKIYQKNHLKITHWFSKRKDKQNAREYCAVHMAKMTGVDLIDVVVLKLCPRELFNELEERGLLIEAASAYLQMDPSYDYYGMKASTLALTTPSGVAAINRGLVSIWSLDGYGFKSNGETIKSPQLQVSLLLALVAGDIEALIKTDIPKECFSALGKDVVYKSILYRGPSKTDLLSILTMFDQEAFENTSQYTILKDLVKHGSSTHSLRYAEQLATLWTTDELDNILFEFKHRSEIIRREIERRKLYFVYVKLCLDEGKASPAGLAIDYKIVISTRKEDYVIQLLNIWRWCDKKKAKSPCSVANKCLMADLWNLWKCPWALSLNSRSALIVHLGSTMIRVVASGKLPIDLVKWEEQCRELSESLYAYFATKATDQ